jgi:hypothetical protein
LGSSPAETNTTVGGIKSKTAGPKNGQKEEARRAVRRRAGRKDQARRREYQTGGFPGISFRR